MSRTVRSSLLALSTAGVLGLAACGGAEPPPSPVKPQAPPQADDETQESLVARAVAPRTSPVRFRTGPA
jgi:hypothetical protein